jgi:diguanylate cyclase (GGDEF)-like protein
MILLPEATLKEAETVADKLREMVANKLNAVSGYAVTISAGVVQVSEIDTADSIFKRVDALLYKAKDMGKNEVRSRLD